MSAFLLAVVVDVNELGREYEKEVAVCCMSETMEGLRNRFIL